MKHSSLLVFAASVAVAMAADVPLYGQCGGTGYTGPTNCAKGVCQFMHAGYSQCIAGPAKPPVHTTPSPHAPVGTPKPLPTHPTPPSHPHPPSPPHSLPTSFQWKSTGPLIGPKPDERNIAGIKDPSIVFYKDHYHVFASTAVSAGYSLVYTNFTDFDKAPEAPFFYLDQAPLGTGYRAAPEVFFFEPQQKWYLVYQNDNSAYSTNDDITNPAGWTAPEVFYPDGMPKIIKDNIGEGYWVDMWVICDKTDCFLFSSDDNGHLYRSQTSIQDFPNGFTQPVIAIEDSTNRFNLFEASNIYHVEGREHGEDDSYLLIVEAIGSDNRRYFRSWTSDRIDGTWTALADTEANSFARANNVVFGEGEPVWTNDISHGEMIRAGHDQRLTISPCKIRYIYQGMDPAAGGDYNGLPWRLALLTQTNSEC